MKKTGLRKETRTAHEAYKQRMTSVRKRLMDLARALDDMDIEEAYDKLNWGYHGNAEHIDYELKELVRFVRNEEEANDV